MKTSQEKNYHASHVIMEYENKIVPDMEILKLAKITKATKT